MRAGARRLADFEAFVALARLDVPLFAVFPAVFRDAAADFDVVPRAVFPVVFPVVFPRVFPAAFPAVRVVFFVDADLALVRVVDFFTTFRPPVLVAAFFVADFVLGRAAFLAGVAAFFFVGFVDDLAAPVDLRVDVLAAFRAGRAGFLAFLAFLAVVLLT